MGYSVMSLVNIQKSACHLDGVLASCCKRQSPLSSNSGGKREELLHQEWTSIGGSQASSCVFPGEKRMGSSDLAMLEDRPQDLEWKMTVCER